MKPMAPKPHAETAMFVLCGLPATGAGIFAAVFLSAAVMGMKLKDVVEVLGKTL
jgi:hypothetical protein